MYVSLGLLVAAAASWIALRSSALSISDSGVRRESLFLQKAITWGEIMEE